MLKCYWADIALFEELNVFELWLEKVNEQRREKVLRCKNIKDRQRSLLAGILLRYALEKEDIFYETAVFSKTIEGKPFLETHEDLHFSLSHAGAYAVCVISDTSVGVDIECLDRSIFQEQNEHRLCSMAKKCLSQREWDKFEESEQKSQVFLEFWTKKEAYSKAVGKGLGMEFSKIDTEINKERYWSKRFTDEYCISIYSETGDYIKLSMEQIIAL